MLTASAQQVGRRQAAQATTIGLGAAYVLGSFAFAKSYETVAPGWIGSVSFWPSLAVAGLTLYGCAGAYGGWAGAAIARHPGRALWLGAAYGELTLLTVTLAGSGWNFAQEAIRFQPYPGTTPADFYQHLGSSFFDYVVKPLAWVLPLGSVAAGLLGAWFGRRVRARLAA